jgi:lysophospholipase L1-like esterase
MLIPFLLAMLAASLVLFFLSRAAVERIERNHYQQRADLYRFTPIKQGDIVFLGDSITDGGCWEEFFPGLPVKNRGINGDDTEGVLNRLGTLLYRCPGAIFLLIGTNDLNWWHYRHDDEILETYEQILQNCMMVSPDTEIFVQSLLPRRKRYTKHLLFLNEKLQGLAKKYGAVYIDLYSHFAAADGSMRPELTNDYLHLMSPGYKKWVEILTPYLKKVSESSKTSIPVKLP